MNRWTHREFLVRKRWVDEQWNKPNRSDYYLMRIAAEIRHVLRGGTFDLSKYKIPFQTGQISIRKDNVKQRTRRSMAFWAPLIAIAKRETKDGNGN